MINFSKLSRAVLAIVAAMSIAFSVYSVGHEVAVTSAPSLLSAG
ncbi:hypothetical protein [Neiella holothuriorum]|nr:hypothetical protein [Neiella holothuriorum]